MAEYAARLANSADTIDRMRRVDAFGLTPAGSPTLARSGLRPDGGGVVTVNSGLMSVSVTAFAAWVDGGASDAQVGYPLFLDAGKTLAIAAGHASLVRVDTIVAQVRDTAYDGSGSTDARVYVVQGTPGAGAPALPQSAVALRDISVHAGASSGTGGLTAANLSTDRRQYVTGLGGVLPVASQAERDALTSQGGNLVYRSDTDSLQVKASGGWRDLPHQAATVTDILSSLTGSAGWTLQSAGYVKFGPIITLSVACTRTGADMGPLSSGGNLTPDIPVFTGLPVAIRPTTLTPGTLWRPQLQTGTVEMSTAGAASFTDGVSSATYAGLGTTYQCRWVYALGL